LVLLFVLLQDQRAAARTCREVSSASESWSSSVSQD